MSILERSERVKACNPIGDYYRARVGGHEGRGAAGARVLHAGLADRSVSDADRERRAGTTGLDERGIADVPASTS